MHGKRDIIHGFRSVSADRKLVNWAEIRYFWPPEIPFAHFVASSGAVEYVSSSTAQELCKNVLLHVSIRSLNGQRNLILSVNE
jgi:hypothetical protein